MRHATHRKQPARKPAAKSRDAVTLLMDDHRMVKKLFKDFERLAKNDGSAPEKSAIVRRICSELSVHTRVEEEIFYPAVRKSINDAGDLVDEADVEHDGAKSLIAQLEGMKPGD